MGIRIKETDKQIQKQISSRLSAQINKVIEKNRQQIVNKVKFLATDWILSQPEISSIVNEGVPGSLNAQLGFLPGQAAEFSVAIALAVANSVQVHIKPVDKNLKGQIVFNIQPSTYENLLSSNFAFIRTETIIISWLNWLLKAGTQTIVFGYDYTPSNYGRSGGGYMRKGSAWRIPVEFAGTSDDNFITRAFAGRGKELSDVIKEILLK